MVQLNISRSKMVKGLPGFNFIECGGKIELI